MKNKHDLLSSSHSRIQFLVRLILASNNFLIRTVEPLPSFLSKYRKTLQSSSCLGPENSSWEMSPSLSLSSWLKISSTNLSWSPSICSACSACSPPAVFIASTCNVWRWSILGLLSNSIDYKNYKNNHFVSQYVTESC